MNKNTSKWNQRFEIRNKIHTKWNRQQIMRGNWDKK
jgi:hypothetical protein